MEHLRCFEFLGLTSILIPLVVLSFTGCAQQVECVQATRRILPGESIEPNSLRTRKTSKDNLPQDAIATEQDAQGLMVKFGIEKDQIVRKNDLAPVGSRVFGEWQQLFDGRTLKGWVQKNGEATYRVEREMIIGRTKAGSVNSFLCTEEAFGDFELELDVKIDPELNSGIQIRSKDEGAAPPGRVNGPQVEVEDIKDGGKAGYLYGEMAGGWMTNKQPHKIFKSGEWNHYRIIATGPRICTWVNGVPTEDLSDEDKFKSHPFGFVGLQVHAIPPGAGPYEVSFKDIRIRRIL